MIDRGRRSVLGVRISVADEEAVAARILDAAREQAPLGVAALAVHGVMTGRDPAHRSRLNALDVLTADGQPVRWALRLLHGERLPERVYGPDLAARVLDGCAAGGLPVYLYGSTVDTLRLLGERLPARHPGLVIAGMEPSRFGTAGPDDLDHIAGRMRACGARVVLVGLGCPRQEHFAWAMKDRVGVPLLAVGAAFDYHAGGLTRPPAWMQRAGLEWLHRLAQEPRRLWRRYLLLNPAYVALVAAQASRLWRPDEAGAPDDAGGPVPA